MNFNRKPIFGVGINDADYRTQITEVEWVDGKRRRNIVFSCPYYLKWKGMLERCYSPRYHRRQPTYIGCEVSNEWMVFSNFRKWMVEQECILGTLVGLHLDKDILGNKTYSKETCVFVPRIVNNFISEGNHQRSKYLMGCVWKEPNKKYEVFCGNPFKGKQEYLGLFKTEVEGHEVWRVKKHLHAVALANSEYVVDKRVKEVLLNKYK